MSGSAPNTTTGTSDTPAQALDAVFELASAYFKYKVDHIRDHGRPGAWATPDELIDEAFFAELPVDPKHASDGVPRIVHDSVPIERVALRKLPAENAIEVTFLCCTYHPMGNVVAVTLATDPRLGAWAADWMDNLYAYLADEPALAQVGFRVEVEIVHHDELDTAAQQAAQGDIT